MDFSAVVRLKAEERILTCSKYTGSEYGPRCFEILVGAEQERIVTALLDSVCPPIQEPIQVPE